MATAAVPADGPVRLGSVELPVGKGLSAWHDDAPVMWAICEPVPSAGRVWQVLTDMHQDTGLVPIVLAFLDRGHEGRPWDTRELDPRCDLAAVDRLDAATVLAEQWWVPTQAELESDPELAAMVAPYGEKFPGLAPAQEQALICAVPGSRHFGLTASDHESPRFAASSGTERARPAPAD